MKIRLEKDLKLFLFVPHKELWNPYKTNTFVSNGRISYIRSHGKYKIELHQIKVLIKFIYPYTIMQKKKNPGSFVFWGC